jgi:alpha-1,6-mannosyltransferase
VITPACWLLSVAGMLTVALLGVSAAVSPLPGSTQWPPYSLSVAPADGVVFAIEGIAVVAGAVATWRLLTALRGKWDVDPRWLHAAGFVVAGVMTVLPPVAGADIKNYIAYGQEAASGVNPYTSGPQSPGVPQDAITRSVEAPWQTTPSVYGPVFTRLSHAVADVADGDGHLAVTLTRLLFAGAFLLTGILLHRLCATDAGRRRAAVLWSANPLLLFTLVAGAHVDVLVAAVVVCSLALVRRSPLGAGAAIGLVATLKLSGLVALPGMVWASRQRPRSAVLIVVGAGAFALPWFVATSGVLTQLHRASRFTTPATPWRALSSLIQPALGYDVARSIVDALAVAAGLVLIAVLLRRGLPPVAADTPAGRAAALVTATTIGWLFTAPYVLPWYDALAWAPLALAGASFLDRVLLVHTTVLVIAFLPGRVVRLDAGAELANRVLHSALSPVVLAALILVTAWLAARRQQTVTPGPTRPGQYRKPTFEI